MIRKFLVNRLAVVPRRLGGAELPVRLFSPSVTLTKKEIKARVREVKRLLLMI
ncbi:MAG: hypothetical protein P4N60_03395 [Verrucomicrobiae bacterium]|nr:hypothetical protein [Verrucomicrobiae bacterium]